jgi:hypothetical protein
MVGRGHLLPVLLPSTAKRRPGDLRLRKLLFDPADVQALIAKMKQQPTAQ